MMNAVPKLKTSMKLRINRSRRSLLALPLLSAAALWLGVHAGGAQTVHFPDPNLEAAITNNLYPLPAPYTPAQLQALTNLYAGDYNIRDTTGLEYATNLAYLVLNGDPVTNFSGITSLTNLTELDLWYSSLTNFPS